MRTSHHPSVHSFPLLVLCVFVLPHAKVHGEDNWSQFRGPSGRGHSTARDVPLKWSAESVLWKVPLKGKGQSSPVNWDGKLFLTGASDDGRERYLHCLDGVNGKSLWEKTIACGSPEKPHSSRCSPA